MNDLAFLPSAASGLTAPGQTPTLISTSGLNAARRFIEFFTADIRNPNTRAASARAVVDFFGWCERHGVGPYRRVAVS